MFIENKKGSFQLGRSGRHHHQRALFGKSHERAKPTTEGKFKTFRRRGGSGKRLSKSTESSHDETRLEKPASCKSGCGMRVTVFHDQT